MKYIKLKPFAFAFTILVMIAFGCKKPGIDPIGSEGQTIVKLPSEEGYNLIAINVQSTAQTFNVLEIRRDVANQSQLNSPMTVVVMEDASVITAYNAAHSTNYERLPTASYTVDASNPRVGSDYTVTFGPGEFYKPIKITVPNSAALDLSKSYAVGFRIKSIDGQGKISESQKSVLVEVALKNKYDGVYRMTGTLVDVAVPGITAKSPTTVHLVTTGANTVEMYNAGTTTSSWLYLFPILNAGAESAYGGFLPEFQFDANDNVTAVVNAYGQPNPANTRSAQLDPSGVNKWVNGVLRVKFFMFQPNTVASGPRASFDFTFEYVGPR